MAQGRSEGDLLAKIERAKNRLAQTQGDLDERARTMNEARKKQDAAFQKMTDAEDAAWNETSPEDIADSRSLVTTADGLRNLCIDCLGATQEARKARKIRDDARDALAQAEAEFETVGRGKRSL